MKKEKMKKENLKVAIEILKAKIKGLRKEVRSIKAKINNSEKHINELTAKIEAGDGSAFYYKDSRSMENSRKSIFVKDLNEKNEEIARAKAEIKEHEALIAEIETAEKNQNEVAENVVEEKVDVETEILDLIVIDTDLIAFSAIMESEIANNYSDFKEHLEESENGNTDFDDKIKSLTDKTVTYEFKGKTNRAQRRIVTYKHSPILGTEYFTVKINGICFGNVFATGKLLKVVIDTEVTELPISVIKSICAERTTAAVNQICKTCPEDVAAYILGNTSAA